MNILLAALLLPLPQQSPAEDSAPEPRGQLLEDGELVDYDYGFVLGPVLPDWLLWDEQQCSAAGLGCVAQMRPLYEDWPSLRLTVEPTASTDAETYYERVLTLEGLEGVPDSGRAIEVDGVPGWEADFLIPGEPVEAGVMRVLVRDSWAYRLQYSDLQTARPPAAEVFPSLAKRLRLVGQPRPRAHQAVEAQRGRDWELDADGFRSSAYGFALEPGPAWRATAGIDAEWWGEWLDVVLEHSDGRQVLVYGVTVPPEEVSTAAERWLERRRREFEEDGVACEQVVLSTRFGDLKALRRTDGWIYDEIAVEAVLDLGPLLCVLDGWQEAGLSPSAESAVIDVAESFRLMEPKELEALRERLAAPGGGPARIGLDWSLRHGVYSDFRTGMRLPIPDGWRARTAAEPWSEPELRLQSPDLELSVDFYRYDAGEDPSLSALHEASVESMIDLPDSEIDAPVSLQFGPARALMTEIRATPESGGGRSRVYDVIHGVQGLEIWVSAFDSWPEGAESAVQGLLEAMDFPEGGLPHHRAGDDFRDERFGWALQRPGDAWRGTAEADSIGEPRSEVTWTLGSRRAVVAAMPAETLPDPWWGLADVLEKVRPELLLRPVLFGSVALEQVTWAGLPARRIVLEQEQLRIYTARLDGIAYVMVLSGPTDDAGLGAFAEGFRLWPGD